MDAATLNTRLSASLGLLIGSADELRDLDQALGDGDLGITVSAGADAVIEALAALPADAVPADVLRAAARAFGKANPSTMAALVAGALLAGSKEWADVSDVALEDVRRLVAAASASIAQRGKTQPGDKTILDGLVAVRDALHHTDDSALALDGAVLAAAEAVERTTAMQSRRGRASWLQERSIGLPDPGAAALSRFVEAWRTAG